MMRQNVLTKTSFLLEERPTPRFSKYFVHLDNISDLPWTPDFCLVTGAQKPNIAVGTITFFTNH